MFFRTNQKLLRPLHSLLKSPFEFEAGISVSKFLRRHLVDRSDYQDLIKLADLYDRARLRLLGTLPKVRFILEHSISALIPQDATLKTVCRTKFGGKLPYMGDMDGATYLAYVSTQCQLERLYDCMALRHMGESNPLGDSDVVDIIRFLMLNEALALALAGLAKVEISATGQYEISPFDALAKENLRAIWFARSGDQGSQGATIVMAKMLADEGATSAYELTPLVERILSQDLSIPWGRLNEEGRALNSIKHIHEAASLVAVLMTAHLRNETIESSRTNLARFGIDFSSVSQILRRQSESLITDQFIGRNGNALTIRVEATSKGIRNYYSVLEKEFNERELLRKYVGGIFFEKRYIQHRLENDYYYKSRYQVFEGFDRNRIVGKAKNECDVEFILRDGLLCHYYFIQIKHALLGERAFFESAVQAMQGDIGYGVKQLREAKRLLDSSELQLTLAQRNINDATPENCTFVLLHNIAQFDFQCTGDGVAMYDWATFRNLLRDAEVVHGSTETGHKIFKLSTSLLIDHPKKVIDRLVNEHPIHKMRKEDYWAAERATTEYCIEGKDIVVSGLGI